MTCEDGRNFCLGVSTALGFDSYSSSFFTQQGITFLTEGVYEIAYDDLGPNETGVQSTLLSGPFQEMVGRLIAVTQR